MAVARDDIVARWPSLSSLPAGAEWDAAIADAGLRVAASVWGEFTDLGTIHLAAHQVMQAHPELAGTGPVQSERVGGVSRTYAVAAAPGGGSYGATAAGRAYLSLRSSLGLGITVV